MQAEINSLKKQAAGTEDPESVVNLQSALKEQQAEAEQMRAAYEQRMKELSETNEDRAKRANDIRTAQEKALGGCVCVRTTEGPSNECTHPGKDELEIALCGGYTVRWCGCGLRIQDEGVGVVME